MPDAWAASVSQDLENKNSNVIRWWEQIGDPVLIDLIERARAENPSLRLVAQSVQEARARRGVARSTLFPIITGGGNISRSRSSENLTDSSDMPPALAGLLSPDNPSDLYTSGFDVAWEIDFFGGLRRAVESADAGIDVADETYRDALVTLLAEVALNYIDYRTTEEQIRLTNDNIRAQTESFELTEARLDAGLTPRTDVTQAETNLNTSRARVPLLHSQRDAIKNTLAVLVGGFPESIEQDLARPGSIPVPSRKLTAGLPADLLRSRADIRAAERTLAAQTALIGVATADLLPRFSLFGSFNLQSADTSDFFESGSRAYSLGPSFSWQIFTAGRIRNNIRIEEARTEQALASYENTVLQAVAEVETTLSSAANEWERRDLLERAVASADETVVLLKDNYQNGLVSFQPLLDAERIKLDTEDLFAVSRGTIAKAYIRLYKALGGGSELEVVPVPQPEAQGFELFGKPNPEDANKPLPRL